MPLAEARKGSSAWEAVVLMIGVVITAILLVVMIMIVVEGEIAVQMVLLLAAVAVGR